MNNTENLETPAFERKKLIPKTQILLTDITYDAKDIIEVLEPYRTVRRLMNEARTHFEVTMRSKKKILISVKAVASILELD